MKMTGEQNIPCNRAAVWKALNDLDVLKECIPGCDSITSIGDNEHEVNMTAAVGPVKAKFKGKLKLTDINAPTSYRIQFQGQGGAAGFAAGEASVNLADAGADTLLTYTADAQIGGRLAQIGSRLIDSAAKKIADEFFGRFNAKVAAANPSTVSESSAVAHFANTTDSVAVVDSTSTEAAKAATIEVENAEVSASTDIAKVTTAAVENAEASVSADVAKAATVEVENVDASADAVKAATPDSSADAVKAATPDSNVSSAPTSSSSNAASTASTTANASSSSTAKPTHSAAQPMPKPTASSSSSHSSSNANSSNLAGVPSWAWIVGGVLTALVLYCLTK